MGMATAALLASTMVATPVGVAGSAALAAACVGHGVGLWSVDITKAEGDGSIAAARPRSHVAWIAGVQGVRGRLHTSPSLVSLVLSIRPHFLRRAAGRQHGRRISDSAARARSVRCQQCVCRCALCLRSPIANVLPSSVLAVALGVETVH